MLFDLCYQKPLPPNIANMKTKDLLLNKLHLLSTLMAMLACLSFSACGSDDDDNVPQPETEKNDATKLTVTNSSRWSLGYVYVEFYRTVQTNIGNGITLPSREKISTKNYTSFVPGASLTVDIPSEADEYIFGTVVDNENFNSGYQSVKNNTLVLTDANLETWGLIAAN